MLVITDQLFRQVEPVPLGKPVSMGSSSRSFLRRQNYESQTQSRGSQLKLLLTLVWRCAFDGTGQHLVTNEAASPQLSTAVEKPYFGIHHKGTNMRIYI